MRKRLHPVSNRDANSGKDKPRLRAPFATPGGPATQLVCHQAVRAAAAMLKVPVFGKPGRIFRESATHTINDANPL